MAAALLPEAAVFTARSATCAQGVRARASCPAVLQDLRDVARDRSFKHVFLGVVVTRIRSAGVSYFCNGVFEPLRSKIAVPWNDEVTDGVGHLGLKRSEGKHPSLMMN